MLNEPITSETTAIVDGSGLYLEVSELMCSLLGRNRQDLLGTRSFVRIPNGPDECWWIEERIKVDSFPLVCALTRDEGTDHWRLVVEEERIYVSTRGLVEQYAVRAFEAVSQLTREAAVKTLTQMLVRLCEFNAGCIIVLIDKFTGAVTFAGGISRREHLAAIEECRRLGAPMVIFQAHEEERIVAKRGWVTQVHNDPRFAPTRPFVHMGKDDLSPYIAIPMMVDGECIGVIAGMTIVEGAITPKQAMLWWELGLQTARALQTMDEIRRAGMRGGDRERRRLNEDLHDTVAQDVFALKMLVARLELVAQRTSDFEGATDMSELRSMTEKISSRLRELIGERRQVGQMIPLSQQLHGLAKEMGSRTGINVDVQVGEEWNGLSDECLDTVVRITQEGLRNVIKHSNATRATLRLAADLASPGMLLIELSDDGTKFDTKSNSSASFGLTFIRERVSDYGGAVELRLEPRTTLRVWIRPVFESEWRAIAPN